MDIKQLAEGQHRRSSATIASAVLALESLHDCDPEIDDTDAEAVMNDLAARDRLRLAADSLRWALGDASPSDKLTLGCFGEDSAEARQETDDLFNIAYDDQCKTEYSNAVRNGCNIGDDLFDSDFVADRPIGWSEQDWSALIALARLGHGVWFQHAIKNQE